MIFLFRWFKRLLGLILFVSFVFEAILYVLTLGIYNPWDSDGTPDSKLFRLASKLLES
jgi:hypothetical protein